MRLAKAFLVNLTLIINLIPVVSAAFTARTETYVNQASDTTPFDFTINKPSGTVDGDILFTFMCIYVSGTPPTVDSVPSGWNIIATRLVSTNYRFYLYYKVASGEPTSWTWSLTATSFLRVVCSSYTSGDFNPADPVDVYSDTQYITADAILRAASMTVAATNSPLVFFGGVYHTSSRTFTKPSVPTTGWVEDDDAGSTTPDWWTTVDSFIWSGSGATGNMDATISTADAHKHAFAVALNPPGASEYNRAASQALTWAGATSRTAEYGRAAAQELTWGGVASRLIEYSRSATQVVAWSGAASGLADYLRGAAQSIGVSGAAQGLVEYVRSAVQGLTFYGSINAAGEYLRGASQTLSIGTSISLAGEYLRGASQSLVTGFDSVGGILGVYNAAANLVLYIKASDGPTPSGSGPSGSLLIVFAGILIVVVLSMRRGR